ncbi:MAG: hypothetical protein AB7G93_06375 [Bdellovibrionales bacterium]
MKLSLGFLIAAATSASAHTQIHVQVNPVADLVYQLDCVAGVELRCSSINYTTLWTKTFLRTGSQREGLRKWKVLRQKINESVADGARPEFDLNSKFQIASTQARSFEDYLTRLDLILTLKNKEAVREILQLYWPSYERWWTREAGRIGKPIAAETARLLKSKSVQQRVDQFRRFYQSQLPAGFTMTLTLHYRPLFVAEPGSGTQMDNYSRMEFHSKEKPSRLLDVVIHELCHFLYRSGDEAKFQDLKTNFFQLDTVESVAAYSLLNETLATVFGNGIFNHETMAPKEWAVYASKENSFYNDPTIDKAAKALLPFMEKYLEEDGTLYGGKFPEKYISILKGALADSLSAPINILREIAMVTDFEPASEISDDIIRYLQPSAIHGTGPNLDDKGTFEYYGKNRQVSALLVVHPENLRKLLNNQILEEKQFREIASKRAPFLFSFRRSPSAYTIVLVASDRNQLKSELDRLARMPKEFDGFSAKTP